MAYYGPLEILERIGVSFEVDWDGEVTANIPRAIDTQAVTDLIADCDSQIKQSLESRRKDATRMFIGGPFAGRKHNIYSWDGTFVHRISRANWVAYKVQGDGRAVFRGKATSKKKAKALARSSGETGKVRGDS